MEPRHIEWSPSRFRVKPLTSAILWAGCSAAAAAEPVVLPPVSVTASEERRLSSPKATAPLVDTPQTITVIPREVFSQQGARNLTDVLKNTPGISFDAGENGFGTNSNNFSLRGFDTSGNIFIDGSRDSGNYSRDVFNIEQVEVVKGPAADNGRGGAGGYVNLVTKSPGLENAVSGSLSYGFDGTHADTRKRATFDVNQVIGSGAAFRLNLMGQDGGVAGREHAQKDAWGVAPSIAFGLGSPTRVILALSHQENDDRPDWGVPGAMIKGMFSHDDVADDADRDNFFGLKSDFDEVTADSALVRIEHDFSPSLRISNQTRWSETEREARYTVPSGYEAATLEATTQTQFYYRETTSLSNLTNLSAGFATGGLAHRLSAGLELTREESDSDRFGTGSAGNTSIFDPNPERHPGFPLNPVQTSAVKIDTVAAYLYDTVELNEHWEITAGVRAERYEVEIGSRNVDGTPQGPDGYERSETSVGGKFGVVYKPAKNGSLYAAVSQATLPPGSFLSNPDISREGSNAFPGLVGQNSEEAREQKATNYEIGTKWSFYDNRLSTTAALFRTERRDVAMTGLAPGQTGNATLQGYGSQVVEGIELSIDGRPTDAWSIFGGIAYMDSERKHSAYLDDARRSANTGDYATYTSTRGDELAFTPKLTANLWTTYRFPFGLTVGGGVQYVDESYLGRPDHADRIIPNGRWGKLPDYTVFNLMALYEVNRNVTVRLNVDNVTDELYAISSNWGGSRAELGVPRSYLLGVDFNF